MWFAEQTDFFLVGFITGKSMYLHVLYSYGMDCSISRCVGYFLLEIRVNAFTRIGKCISKHTIRLITAWVKHWT